MAKLVGLVALLLTFCLMIVPIEASAPYYEPEPELAMVQGNPLLPTQAVYTPKTSLTYRTLINCLEFYESSGNPNAVGDAGEIGCLQFLPTTFQHYCVEKYGFPDDIWSCGIQKECADKMITDRWNNVYHWTVAQWCI
jgi:hypothetical protein